jgi:hypothetical protein
MVVVDHMFTLLLHESLPQSHDDTAEKKIFFLKKIMETASLFFL